MHFVSKEFAYVFWSGGNLFKNLVIAVLIRRVRYSHFFAVQKVFASCRRHIADMLRRASLFLLLVAVAATSADFECPEVEGIFPDPDDCRSFYQGLARSMTSTRTFYKAWIPLPD